MLNVKRLHYWGQNTFEIHAQTEEALWSLPNEQHSLHILLNHPVQQNTCV